MKTLFLGIALLILCTLVAAVSSSLPTPAGQAAQASYRGAAGISFTYPTAYALSERSDSFEGSPIVVVTLIDAGVKIPDQSDGPQLISVIEVPNPENLPLEEWVMEKSISNFSLSPDKKISPAVVGGEPAVSYRHSGLYESEAVAVAHAGKIYLLSVGSTSSGDQIYKDFQNLLKTVQFK